MSERRTLVEGMKEPPLIDPHIETEFVYGGKAGTDAFPKPLVTAAITTTTATTTSRAPVSTRIRSDFAAALKRASLWRQLSGQQPSTLRDILAEAIEPWLRANGYVA